MLSQQVRAALELTKQLEQARALGADVVAGHHRQQELVEAGREQGPEPIRHLCLVADQQEIGDYPRRHGAIGLHWVAGAANMAA